MKEIRSDLTGLTATGRRIEGYAIVFNQLSELLPDNASGRVFKEIIIPSALTRDVIMRSDIRCVLDHDYTKMLARCKKGKGTLDLTIDAHGLKYSFEAPHTAHGDYAVEMIKRGDIQGSSFRFSIEKGGDSWDQKGDHWIRIVKKIDKLYDVTITPTPAYTGTSVSAREWIKKARRVLLQAEKKSLELNAEIHDRKVFRR